MAEQKKLTENQIGALAMFYAGASALLKGTTDKSDALTFEEAKKTLAVLNVGATLTAAQFAADMSFEEVYGDGAPSLNDPPIEDTAGDADVIDLQEYRQKGGLLN